MMTMASTSSTTSRKARTNSRRSNRLHSSLLLPAAAAAAALLATQQSPQWSAEAIDIFRRRTGKDNSNSNANANTKTNTNTNTNNQCINDQPGGKVDTGCTMDAPICVNDNGHSPGMGEVGIQCVPCINDHDHPAEPDWGCSSEQPLCVISTTTFTKNNNEPKSTTTAAAFMGLVLEYEPEQLDEVDNKNSKVSQRRPEYQHAGNKCVEYPCHHTSSHPSYQEPDQGCPQETPVCVDALGSHPPFQRPGVQCISTKTTTTTTIMDTSDVDNDTENIYTNNDNERNSETNKESSSSVTATGRGWGASSSPSSSSLTTTWGLTNVRNHWISTYTNDANEQDLQKNGNNNEPRCMISGKTQPIKVGPVAVCGGCPFGITKQCDIAKLSW